jgi:NAD(P)-dependent dehydrogenase (short-subunit alcohol dehydrogenase family)
MSVVLVTGGSSGIGLATVRRLAAAGHQVFSASRNPERAAPPAGVTPVAADVGDAGSGRAAIRSVVSAAGRLDVLVNNAGTGGPGALEEIPDQRAHEIFEVNLFGPMRLAAAAVPVMRASGGGRIINVTSGNDTVPAPFGGWYSASKAALAALPARAAVSLEHAGDPDEVARAIEECMAAGDPPARIVVGADAEEMIKMVRDASPDDLARILREYVAGLAP